MVLYGVCIFCETTIIHERNVRRLKTTFQHFGFVYYKTKILRYLLFSFPHSIPGTEKVTTNSYQTIGDA